MPSRTADGARSDEPPEDPGPDDLETSIEEADHEARRRLRRHGATVLHECKDVDLAVYVSGTSSLRSLQRARSTGVQALFERKQIGVAHHQVDVFLLDAADGRYLGRLCTYGRCPADEPACRVPGCGAAPYLRQHEGFVFEGPEALRGSRKLHP